MQTKEVGWRRLRERREQLGYSKTSLARAIGVTTNCVCHWERANSRPRPRSFTRLAEVLKTSEAWLRGDDDNPSRPAETRDELVWRVKREIAAAEKVQPEQVRISIDL